MTTEPQERLDELDCEEWYEVTLRCKGDITRDEFMQMWEDFQLYKMQHLQRKKLN